MQPAVLECNSVWETVGHIFEPHEETKGLVMNRNDGKHLSGMTY